MLMTIEKTEGTALPLQVALPAPRKPRGRMLWGMGVLIVAGLSFYALAAPPPPMQDAAPPALMGVMALARLMPEGDLIRVAPPHGAGDARLAELRVAVSEQVEAGALLAVLDNAPALEAALLSAEAQVARSAAALLQAQEAVRIARLETAAALAEAEVAAAAAQARLDRAQALAERGITATAARDDLEALAAQSAQAVLRARAAHKRWQTDSGPHPDILAATRALEAARIEADRARADRARAEVRAPVAGTVLEIALRPGERPGAEGVLTLGRTDRMVARAEVFQLDIGRVRVGQRVEVTAPALDGTLHGTVARIGLLVARQNMVSDDTAANTDARVVEVLMALDPESSARAAHLSNLEAMARILTEPAP